MSHPDFPDDVKCKLCQRVIPNIEQSDAASFHGPDDENPWQVSLPKFEDDDRVPASIVYPTFAHFLLHDLIACEAIRSMEDVKPELFRRVVGGWLGTVAKSLAEGMLRHPSEESDEG